MGPIDGDGNVDGTFSGGDPAVPRLPTQVTPDWFNDIQAEQLHIITTGGGTPTKRRTNAKCSMRCSRCFLTS